LGKGEFGPRLPNANPIENVWALTRQIRLIWRSLPNEYVNLVESMPRKCQAIINAGGDWSHF